MHNARVICKVPGKNITWHRTSHLSNDIGPLQLFGLSKMHNMSPANPTLDHTQITLPNNIIYLPPEDEWKHWLYAAILIYFDFRFLGFRVLIQGLSFLGFRFWTIKRASLTQGFEHGKGYAGSVAGKRGVCSEHVMWTISHTLGFTSYMSKEMRCGYMSVYDPRPNLH